MNYVVPAGGAANDVRFFFFFPAPGTPLTGSGGGPLAGVESFEAAGAGVLDSRIFVLLAGVASAKISALLGKELGVKDILECAAVARMALTKRILFFCLFGASDRLGRALVVAPSICGVAGSASSFFLLTSDMPGSVIGHTNPVRGVYSGRCLRRLSRDD